MEENIRCPKCGSSNMKEESYKAAAGTSSSGKYPGEEEHIKYRCRDCGHEIYEGDEAE